MTEKYNRGPLLEANPQQSLAKLKMPEPYGPASPSVCLKETHAGAQEHTHSDAHFSINRKRGK